MLWAVVVIENKSITFAMKYINDMIKVYFGNRMLVLAYNTELDSMSMDFNAIHGYSNTNELAQFVDKFIRREDLTTGCIYYHNLAMLDAKFKSLFHYINAAGGLVCNGEGRYLVMERNGVVDLPKGKAEKGEKIEQTALREVEEETGVKVSHLGDEICCTYHIYKLGDTMALKKTQWYNMTVEGVPEVTPQTEENITKIMWVDAQELKALATLSYPSVRTVVEKALNQV